MCGQVAGGACEMWWLFIGTGREFPHGGRGSVLGRCPQGTGGACVCSEVPTDIVNVMLFLNMKIVVIVLSGYGEKGGNSSVLSHPVNFRLFICFLSTRTISKVFC